MRIELQEIKIENFKGVKSLALDFADGLCVRGDNGTGKTTIFDAVCWVLFDKDSKGIANSQIKPVDADGAEINHLESIVETLFVVDGKPVGLKKSYKEKWTKKRGAATRTFEGHTTDYSVNGVPASLKEYKLAVGAIVEEGIFKLLTNPYEFAGLHWKERRAILIQLCGDVTDADVIASNGDLSGLSAILGDRSIDDVKKILQQRHKAINKDLNDIPVRIQELNRTEPVEQPDLGKKAMLNCSLDALKSRLSTETDTSAIKEKELAVREISVEMSVVRNSAVVSPEKVDIEARISNLKSQVNQKNSGIEENGFEISSLSRRQGQADTNADDLRKRWRFHNETQFSADLTCPTCGQEMPEDSIDDARAAFNKDKSEKLASINANGKNEASESKALGEKIEGLKASNKALNTDVAGMLIEIGALSKELPALEPVVDQAAMDALSDKRRVIEHEITTIKSGSASRTDAIKIDIEEVESKISAIATQEAAATADVERLQRIKDLEAQERKLGLEFEETERQLHTMDAFVISKVDMLESSINSRFKLATFKMFKEQVNGGIEECCEILCGGVPFGRGLNTGASINTGLDIINTLSEYHCVQAPIFVDNSESITQLIDTGSQLIKLIVDPEAKTLTQAKE